VKVKIGSRRAGVYSLSSDLCQPTRPELQSEKVSHGESSTLSSRSYPPTEPAAEPPVHRLLSTGHEAHHCLHRAGFFVVATADVGERGRDVQAGYNLWLAAVDVGGGTVVVHTLDDAVANEA
jgi:hypothetical protein